MKLKLRMMILFCSISITLPTYLLAFNSINSKNIDGSSLCSTYGRNRRHKVHIKTIKKCTKKRSILSASAYVEDNMLYLHFNDSLENVALEVINVDTGELVFSGKFTGTSIAIPLQEDGYEFNINIDDSSL